MRIAGALLGGMIAGFGLGFLLWGGSDGTHLPEFKFRFNLDPESIRRPVMVECERRPGVVEVHGYSKRSEGWHSLRFSRPDADGCVTVGQDPVDHGEEQCANNQAAYCLGNCDRSDPPEDCEHVLDYFDEHPTCDVPSKCNVGGGFAPN